jgi:hypothetical protein
VIATADSTPLRSAYIEEERKMTMQVGMVGSDGIILASDRKVWRESYPTVKQIGSVVDPPALQCKIEFSYPKNIAISCAENLDSARDVAKKIIDALRNEDRANEYSAASAMQRIAEDVLGNSGDKIRCLIALTCPDWHLFTCTASPDDHGEYGVVCEPCHNGWEIAGHVTNPAVFLIRRYYSENQSIEELIPLASYSVLCASQFNSERIEDLDVIRCDALGVHRLSARAISKLKKHRWDEAIRTVFSSYREEYNYVPKS